MSVLLNKAALPVVGDGAATENETVGATAASINMSGFGGRVVRARAIGGPIYLSAGHGTAGTDFAVATASNGMVIPEDEERDFFVLPSSGPGRPYTWSAISDGAGRTLKIVIASQ